MRRSARPDPPVALAAAGVADARALALELGGGHGPAVPVDVMRLGVTLEPGESAFRAVTLWLRWQVDGVWSQASLCLVVVTDRRAVARLPVGGLRSFWWGSLVGLDIDLVAGHVVLDYGDGRPRSLSGEGAGVVAVMAVAQAYGVAALTTHAAIAPLRR